MSDFLYIIYSKNRNPFMGELPKYIMQYLDMLGKTNTFSHFLESLRS